MPGITATVSEMLAALTRVAGAETAARVRWKPDARIQTIIGNCPTRFHTARALELGFSADRDIESIIRDYIAEEQFKL